MKTIEQIKQDVIAQLSEEHEENYTSWEDLLDWVDKDLPWEIVCEIYAKEYAREALRNAAENATIWVDTPINGTEFDKLERDIGFPTDPFVEKITVFKESIMNDKNLPNI